MMNKIGANRSLSLSIGVALRNHAVENFSLFESGPGVF